jgi:tetratricopeptide (TPR) repeat protein
MGHPHLFSMIEVYSCSQRENWATRRESDFMVRHNLELEKSISRAEFLAMAGQQEAAMKLACELIEQHPDKMEAWSLRAYLYGRVGKHSDAIADLTHAIEINPMEPHLFYDRGLKHLAQGNSKSAVDDFTNGLTLCDHYNNDYYREPLYFLRADGLLKLGKKGDALEDLQHVRADFSVWTYELRTKAELLAECNELDR